MSTRSRTTRATTTMVCVALPLLAACGSGAGATGARPSATSSTTSGSATASTGTGGAPATTGWPTAAGPSPTRPGKPDPTLTTPPPAHDPAPLPHDARAYAEDFAHAWSHHDTGRGALLATPQAYEHTFAVTPSGTPKLQSCEGAAGSTYCTFTSGDDTMVVRVGNQTASAGEPDGVTEVQFRP
jgi:hypothetical protein